MNTAVLTLSLLITQLPPFGGNRIDAATAGAKAEIEQVARAYRRSVYLNYRSNREEFDRRWNAGKELWERWSALDQPAAYRTDVLAWFAEAETATRMGGSGLPPFPYLPEATVPTALEGKATLPDPPSAPVAPEVTANPELNPATKGPDLNAPADQEHLFLPPPAASAGPASAGAEGELPGKIRSLLNFSETVFSRAKDDQP